MLGGPAPHWAGSPESEPGEYVIAATAYWCFTYMSPRFLTTTLEAGDCLSPLCRGENRGVEKSSDLLWVIKIRKWQSKDEKTGVTKRRGMCQQAACNAVPPRTGWPPSQGLSLMGRQGAPHPQKPFITISQAHHPANSGLELTGRRWPVGGSQGLAQQK